MRTDVHAVKELLRLQLLQNMDLFASRGAERQPGGFESLLAALLQNDRAEQREVGVVQPQRFPGRSLFNPSDVSMHRQRLAQFESFIEKAAGKYGVDAGLIKAVVHAESAFDPLAVSRAGAKGLMQLMDGTARALGVQNPFDPEENIDGGTRFLSQLLRKYKGNVAVALAAYNAGPGTIDRLGVENDEELFEKYGSLPKETQQYVRKVLGLKAMYAQA